MVEKLESDVLNRVLKAVDGFSGLPLEILDAVRGIQETLNSKDETIRNLAGRVRELEAEVQRLKRLVTPSKDENSKGPAGSSSISLAFKKKPNEAEGLVEVTLTRGSEKFSYEAIFPEGTFDTIKNKLHGFIQDQVDYLKSATKQDVENFFRAQTIRAIDEDSPKNPRLNLAEMSDLVAKAREKVRQ